MKLADKIAAGLDSLTVKDIEHLVKEFPYGDEDYNVNLVLHEDSLDAALRLMGEVLPGWTYIINNTGDDGTVLAELYGPEDVSLGWTAPTPARALFAAIVSAKQPSSSESEET